MLKQKLQLSCKKKRKKKKQVQHREPLITIGCCSNFQFKAANLRESNCLDTSHLRKQLALFARKDEKVATISSAFIWIRMWRVIILDHSRWKTNPKRANSKITLFNKVRTIITQDKSIDANWDLLKKMFEISFAFIIMHFSNESGVRLGCWIETLGLATLWDDLELSGALLQAEVGPKDWLGTY